MEPQILHRNEPIGKKFFLIDRQVERIEIEFNVTETIIDPYWENEEGKKIQLKGIFTEGKIKIRLDTREAFQIVENDIKRLPVTPQSRFFSLHSRGVNYIKGENGAAGFISWFGV